MGRTIASGRTLANSRGIAGTRGIRGSGEVVVPLVAYDTTPPSYASGEIGLIDAYTVAITFSEEIVGTNYTTGVTIKKNGVSQTIWYAMRLADHKYVQYVLANPVTSGDTITWEYSVISGNITDIAGNHLLSVSAQTLTNNVAVSTLHYFDNAAGGANNGSSWANAWNSSASINWASVAAGDTVYISGGDRKSVV